MLVVALWRGGTAAPSRRAAKTVSVQALGVREPGLELAGLEYEEPAHLPADAVDVQVHACCLAGADVAQLLGEWGPCVQPLVPGREAVGVVLGVGSAVKGVLLGQRVLVSLGSGLDSEAEDDGADRSARDDLTIGAATHRLRVPARYALPLPSSLPTAAVTGLLGVGLGLVRAAFGSATP